MCKQNCSTCGHNCKQENGNGWCANYRTKRTIFSDIIELERKKWEAYKNEQIINLANR